MYSHRSILVSVPEFAAKTSLSARAVWRLIRAERIPSLRVGRRRLIPLDPAIEALIANDTSIAAPGSDGMQMAWVSVITNENWCFIRGTDKIQGGALKGVTDDNSRLQFSCPSCDTELITHLAGVSGDFVEWHPFDFDVEIPRMPMAVFEVICPWCDLADHFKIMCDQHGTHWTGKPLPPSQSRRARRPDEPRTAPIPIVSEGGSGRAWLKDRPTLRASTDTEYLTFNCPSCDSILRGGVTRLVWAVTDSQLVQSEGVVPIVEFQFEISCGPKCGFVGDFTIPVADQTLRLLEC